jgi:hypothetical protein
VKWEIIANFEFITSGNNRKANNGLFILIGYYEIPSWPVKRAGKHNNPRNAFFYLSNAPNFDKGN